VQSKYVKFARAILISSVVAAATPALAAGLVAGTASAVKVVADAGPMSRNANVDADMQAGASETTVADFSATNGPRRLSPLAGTDEQAWSSARDVHVRSVARNR
jgi:hypothetical protein